MTKSTPLATRILWGLAIGVLAAVITFGIGEIFPPVLDVMRHVSVAVLDPFGQIFLRMLFFVVISLVFASLASGVAQLGNLEKLGPLAGRTFGLFVVNMLIAVILGLLMMNLLQPGHHLAVDAQQLLMQEYGGSAMQAVDIEASQPAMSFATVVEMLMPRNLFGAFIGNSRGALGDVLPLILFAILVGAAATRLRQDKRLKLQGGLDMISEVMTGIVGFARRLAPYAVPALIYSVIVKVGLDILLTLSVFVVGCAVALMLHLFGTMSLWLRFLAHRSPLAFFRKVRPLLITAFSTSSSSATVPAALATAHDDLKRSPSTAGFVLPRGATMNMSGTALFEGCRGVVRGAGVRRRTGIGPAGDTDVAGRSQRGRGGWHSRRLAAVDRRFAGHVRRSAGGHRHHHRRRSHPGHAAHHGQRRQRYRHGHRGRLSAA